MHKSNTEGSTHVRIFSSPLFAYFLSSGRLQHCPEEDRTPARARLVRRTQRCWKGESGVNVTILVRRAGARGTSHDNTLGERSRIVLPTASNLHVLGSSRGECVQRTRAVRNRGQSPSEPPLARNFGAIVSCEGLREFLLSTGDFVSTRASR